MASLVKSIYENVSKVRFHTPSHAGKLPVDFVQTDVTELPYTDNLLCATASIADLEKNVASAYKAEACFISTQGATHNILQAVYAEKDEGAFLVVGMAHASVYNALRVLGAKAYHVDAVNDLLPLPADVKTAVITSPDYFGTVLPTEKICAFFHDRGIRVIVDSAHGSHFMFSSKLPVSATEHADSVILSLHKSLPVMTGGSVLVTKKDRVERCSLCRKLYHTTSPSFPVLCSIERAIEEFTAHGEEYYEKVVAATDVFRKAIRPPYTVIRTGDPTKIVLSSPYDGQALYDAIAEKGFVPEMAFERAVVFIVNPYNYEALPALAEAVNGIRGLPAYEKVVSPQKAHPLPTPIGTEGEPELLPLLSARGRRAYLEVGFYPPGVPLLYANDVITEEHIRLLSDKNREKRIFGLESGKIFVVK